MPGGTPEAKAKRFKDAFATLAEGDNDQLRRVILEIDEECEVVSRSSLPNHCYSHQMIEKNIAIKQIKPDIDDLLVDNSDHFSENAKDAYCIGHTLAINLAIEAGKEKNREKLKLAYAYDAFACHFLTDLFAAGHIRNQRGGLETFLIKVLEFKPEQAKPLAGLLTGAQHEKDGHAGLNVQNGNGEHWRAYGDGNFFSPKNKENKERVIAATQASADEVYYAYSLGKAPDLSTLILSDEAKDILEPIAGLLAESPSEKDPIEAPNGEAFVYTLKSTAKKTTTATRAAINVIGDDKDLKPTLKEHDTSTPVEKLIPFATLFNPLPIYQIKENKLILIRGAKTTEITSKTSEIDCAYQMGEHAVNYLPQDYINGFIDGYIKPKKVDMPLVNKVIIPQVERLTGNFWHMMGLAAYHQVQQENRQLNEKIDEMADTLLATYNNTVEILDEIHKVNEQMRSLTWDSLFGEIKVALEEIKDMTHQFRHHREDLDHHRLQQAEDKLWSAFIRMSRVFEEGTATDKKILEAYQTTLLTIRRDPREVKIEVTLWFRQMLDYQVRAYSLSKTFKFMREGRKEEVVHLSNLESSLTRQIEANRGFIEEELIYRSQDYIVLQIEKSRTKRLASNLLNTH